jgi:hypothetical protein
VDQEQVAAQAISFRDTAKNRIAAGQEFAEVYAATRPAWRFS